MGLRFFWACDISAISARLAMFQDFTGLTLKRGAEVGTEFTFLVRKTSKNHRYL